MLDNLPCIVGVAQRTYRAEDGDAPEPISMWEEVSRKAADDSGAASILNAIDELDVVFSLSWQYDDASVQLAEKLELRAGARQLSGLSGTSPQHFLQQAAEKIIKGERDAVLVTGGEALATKRRCMKESRELSWAKPKVQPDLPFDDPFHPSEIAHEVLQAYLTFAVLDSARRHKLELPHLQNRRQQAQMMASLSEVAADNPNAWFRKSHSADALFEINADNRMVAYPFSKYALAMMDVDMASAVIMVSHKKADDLGIAKEKRIYLRGWAYDREPVYIAERPTLWQSPAMQRCSQRALQIAGIGIDDIEHLDLYSCFASSINFAKDALGLKDDDSRPLSVTGGLPYFGGPGNNYLTHAIATMVEKLRHNPGDYGLINGVGMHMTNHSFAVYSATPGALSEPAAAAHSPQVKSIQDEASGSATIAAYSIVHTRESNWGLAVCDLASGNRCYARIDDQGVLAAMEDQEWIGREISLCNDNKVNRLIS